MTYYDSIAPGYDELYGAEQREKLLIIQKKIVLPSRGSVLDVGCGTGISSDFFADLGFTVTGVDPSSALIAQNSTGKSKLIVGIAEKLPFADDSFDAVVSVSAIQNFTNIRAGLLEIRRVGKGFFVLTVMNKGEHFTEAKTAIEELFEVDESFDALNDTVFKCSFKS